MIRSALILALLLVPLGAQRPPGKSTMEAGLKAWQDAEEAERHQLLRRFALWGDPFRSHLNGRKKDDHHQAEIPDILESLSHLEGRDLLEAKVKPRPSKFTPWVFPAEEIVIFALDGEWVALHIGKGHDPAEGTLSARISTLRAPLQPFRDKGEMVREVSAKGVLAPGKSVMRGAYPERDYKLALTKQCTVVIHSLGANAFRIVYAEGFKVARTGQSKLRKLKPSLIGLHYSNAAPGDYPVIARRLQRYFFRILDGVEPLPTFGTPDEERFAFAEAVQVSIREETGGRPVLLVSFPHLQKLPYDEFVHEMGARFAKRCGKIAPDDIIVWIGGQEPREANRFWAKGKFKAPKGALLKRVRALFPEDY